MPEYQSPRDRLIDTALTLFCERGLPRVGINEVTDRARVARMTLYNNFTSKEALALAAFERLAIERQKLIKEHLSTASTSDDRVTAIFAAAATLASDPKFKGCAFINVAAQESEPNSALHALVRDHKAWVRSLFQEIASQACCLQPKIVAQQLLALWDGGIAEAYIQQSKEPIEAARQAALIILRTRA